MPLDASLADDAAARATALTAIDRTLLVEAGAGSGKTSVLAGRVVVLLASGKHPSAIAAISFTEFTAAELRERIVRFIEEILAGRMPKDLLAAFPTERPTAEQRANLEKACEDLDCLVCLTIHSFCRTLLAPYPVEADIDPGAAPLDRDAADLLFEDVCTNWFRKRLSGVARPDNVFEALYLAEPKRTAETLRELAKVMCLRRGAEVEAFSAGAAELATLTAKAAAFRAFVTAQGSGKCPEMIAKAVQGLENQISEAPTAIEAEMLLWSLRLKAPDGCATRSGEFSAASRVSVKKGWEAILGGGKAMKATIDMLHEQAMALYEDCKAAHAEMQASAAGRILEILAAEAREVLADYDKAKRNSAALDFDDLLAKTKDLLEANPTVRSELAARFEAVLVDEFQDTDPVQLEILWRLCGDPPAGDETDWREWRLRPGALFLVGDPKQSIYRFRGADLNAFFDARSLLEKAAPDCVLSIFRNFRSRACILGWVNERFGTCLSAEGQAGFTGLIADGEDSSDMPGVATVDLECKDTSAVGVRDTEAEEVAKLCRRLVGNVMVRDRSVEGALRKCEPRDIALLVPANTDLWRYERALEDSGLTVATQAGKGFYRRQEVQDLIALTRTLADYRDRLALGALLRGPLVGFPDEVLLDTVAAQPAVASGSGDVLPAQLSLGMDFGKVPNPLLRATLEKLKSLADKRRTCTPHILLCQATEVLNVRAILRQRGGRVAELALANVDLFLEMSRAYDVRGIRTFAEHMREKWEEADKSQDARPDADLSSISLVTMHSGKGLEWPVVIPVNTASQTKSNVNFAYDPRCNRIHMPVFGIHPRGCEEALEREKKEQRFERERLWYVAATRARDLLMLPRLPGGAAANTWASLVDLGLGDLMPFGEDFASANIPLPDTVGNRQDRATFEAEADRILVATPKIKRVTPHLAEEGETGLAPVVVAEELGVAEVAATRGGLARGLILHKLLEEVLTRETADTKNDLTARATELLSQTPLPVEGFVPVEMAEAVLRGLAVPQIAAIRDRLVAEWPVARSEKIDGQELVTLGVADAAALNPDGTYSLVVDWKSDVAPNPKDIAHYSDQLREYLVTTKAPNGLLVFLSANPAFTVPVTP